LKIKKGFFATCSNASSIKMTLTMIPNLLPHGARPTIFLDQADVVDVVLLLMMNDEALMKKRGPLGSAGQYDTWNSIYSTCGPRDMISLVIPILGGNNVHCPEYGLPAHKCTIMTISVKIKPTYPSSKV
jgi:hypothetical protein